MWTLLPPSFMYVDLTEMASLLPTCASLPCLSDVHSDQALLFVWRLPSCIPSSLTEPETPSCWVLKCSKFNPVTIFVTEICHRISYQFVYAFWEQQLVAYLSLHPHHLVHSTWHTAGTQNYWISELDWLIKKCRDEPQWKNESGRISWVSWLFCTGVS